MTASAATVLYEMDREDSVFPAAYVQGNRIAFAPPADVWAAATHVVIYHNAGSVDAVLAIGSWEIVAGYPGGAPPYAWHSQTHRNTINEAGMITDTTITWEMPPDVFETEGVLIADWGVGMVDWLVGDPFGWIDRVVFLGAPAAEAAPAAPAAEAPGVGGEVNPQTGGTFTTTALVVSGVGLVGALAALAFVAKKKK